MSAINKRHKPTPEQLAKLHAAAKAWAAANQVQKSLVVRRRKRDRGRFLPGCGLAPRTIKGAL